MVVGALVVEEGLGAEGEAVVAEGEVVTVEGALEEEEPGDLKGTKVRRGHIRGAGPGDIHMYTDIVFATLSTGLVTGK